MSVNALRKYRQTELGDTYIGLGGAGESLINAQSLAAARAVLELDDELASLTAAEVQQLQNIGTNTISAAQWALLGGFGFDAVEIAQLETIGAETISATQWGYLGGMNQVLQTSSDVTFGTVETNRSDVTSSGVTDVITAYHRTSGTPAAGIGTGIRFKTETADGNDEYGAKIHAITTDVTPTAEIFDLVFLLMTGGAAATESFRIKPLGIQVIQDVTDVSDPPTDAELDAIFGAPASIGAGFIGLIDDNSADTDVWLVYTSDTSWFHLQGTKAL
jgi:hypothetical protein